MEKSKPPTYAFTAFETLKEPVAPPLHEIWNWQGDKTVLPSKVRKSFPLQVSENSGLM
jgi:hypothetical protein